MDLNKDSSPPRCQKTGLLIAPGERFDVIVDFTGIPLGSTIMMTNDAKEPYPDGDDPAVIDLMQIRINTAVPANDPDTTLLPADLKLRRLSPGRDAEPAASGCRAEGDHGSGLDPSEEVPSEVLLNGYHFMDPTTDVIKAGTTETWQWINLTVDAHPMHPHLVASQVVDAAVCDREIERTPRRTSRTCLGVGRRRPTPILFRPLSLAFSAGWPLRRFRSHIPFPT